MKKLFFTLTLIFGLSLSASAQNQKAAPEVLAKQELSALNEMIGLSDQQQTDLYRLFEHKYKTLADPTLSTERKTEFARVADLKLQATLNGDQNQKLAAKRNEYDKVRNSLSESK